ncbi:bifunctional folylpolyglutamate synthase/dihydrofolate synthase [bacterium]|nr:bifunctional folylpolyglutamate synthase/dihydrofolate synthase [bacterium]
MSDTSPSTSTSGDQRPAPLDIRDFDAGANRHAGYRAALEHLYGRLDTESLDPKRFATVERDILVYSDFLAGLSDPHLAIPMVHLTGTRGKGSTVAMLEAILQHGGIRTGATISPHLVEVRERIRINGDSIAFDDFARLYEIMRPVAESALGGGNYRTVFELLTALAFLAFRELNVQLGLVEVGLGGRLDATNVVDPALSIITRIGLDHTHLLGDTVEKIAWDKGHIIKPDRPSISAAQPGNAGDVLAERAREVGSEQWVLDRDIRITIHSVERSGSCFDLETPHRTHKDLRTPLLGRHQAWNAALAVAAADRLDGDGVASISAEQVREGLTQARWAGRGEVIQASPTLLLDGAHTPQGAAALNELLETCWPTEKRVMLLGINRDKDAAGFLNCFDMKPDHAIATAARTPRAMPPCELASLLHDQGWHSRPLPLEEALQAALEEAGPDGLVVVTGSLYLVGAVRRLWLQAKSSHATF